MSFLSLHLTAQNVKLTILPNSIKVQNDSLYFKYRIQNNSDTVFVLYNVGLVKTMAILELEDNPPKIENIRPNFQVLAAFIYDKSGKIPTKMRSTMPPFRPPGSNIKQTYEEFISSFHGKNVVLKKAESIEYDRRLYIADIGLEKGVCEFQLVYYSLDYQNTQEFKQYLKEKNQNIRLKNSFMFDGKLISNVCIFENPYVKCDD